jgi:hypothetical protein
MNNTPDAMGIGYRNDSNFENSVKRRENFAI